MARRLRFTGTGRPDLAEGPRILDPDRFARLFEDFEHSAWHLEMRRRYAVDEEGDDWAQFTAGQQPTWDLDTPWCRTISAKTRDGVYVGRVRILDDPPTTGQRFLLAYSEKNAELGEDVRNMWRADAERVNLPPEDFWIFDSQTVALCLFDTDDQLTGAELITEPVRVNQYNRLRDIALHYATPYKRFAEQLAGQEV